MNGNEIRIIILEKDTFRPDIVHRYQKGWTVRFMRGTSLLGSNVYLSTSVKEGDLEWTNSDDHLRAFTDVICETAGAFEYTFRTEPEGEPCGGGHFLVFPLPSIRDEPLPLDAIAAQTHIVKLLGPLSEWESRLEVAHQSGYNVVHLTPVHQLGISNSAYSISDHHALNNTMHTDSKKVDFNDLAAFIQKMENDWGIITVQDVVWNHAAKNAKWLQEHPECAYNCDNSPHLRPAYVVDRAYHQFSKQVSAGKWDHRGIPSTVDNIHHINCIEYILRSEVLPSLRFHEFFQCDVMKVLKQFADLCKEGPTKDPLDNVAVTLIEDREWKRFGRSVDMDETLRIYNRIRNDTSNEEERIEKCCADLHNRLDELNNEGGKESWDHLMAGLRAMIGHMTYERVDEHGPKYGLVDDKHPLTCDYFLHNYADEGWEKEESLCYDSNTSQHLMAFNGWVMSANPLDNFALPTSKVYLRRELVCWGDSVKLNYGEKPEDCPFLWDYMKTYTIKCAEIFKGVRIDNAHGTPIHVAEYLLRAARHIRPDLYVFAELFTGSEYLDNVFVNRLGITSLIREAQSARDSHEQGRLIYRFGGDSVGAMKQKRIMKAPVSVAHAMLLDQSHDNPSPIKIRSAFDLLPTSAMVSMASCAVGSTRGYDELVRHHIHVVEEKRQYGRWGKEVLETSGIVKARRVLNKLHQWLAYNNYTQVFVDQMNPDVVGITRHNPLTHETVVVVSHTAFTPNRTPNGPVDLKWIPIGGVLEKILFEMETKKISEESTPEDDTHLIGLSNFQAIVRENVPLEESKQCIVHNPNGGHIQLTNFPPGSVIGFKIRMDDAARKASDEVINLIFNKKKDSDQKLKEALGALTLQEFNRLFFCTDAEESALTQGHTYEIPNYGALVFAGLQGIVPLLDEIRTHNDLGHPVCSNLRDGCWLPEYVHKRLLAHGGNLKKVSEVFAGELSVLSDIPYYLRPCYFEAIVQHLFAIAKQQAIIKMHSVFSDSSSFVRSLLIASISFVGFVPGAGLSPLPKSIKLEDAEPSSLAAGLPHFSVGIWRNWGRDTFIALPGCLLATKRYTDARNIILSFGGAMRHGLIPNLLAEGRGARFNCRDAVWFWLYAIVRYVDECPEGKEILNQNVRRIWPNDDTEYGKEEREEPLINTMLEALDRHFCGIAFRERNAGPSIDEHMKHEGFNVTAFVDKKTGFVHGGNQWNCGTWMDKMGSSDKAGNRGEPATPRDGAAVELQGLAYAVLRALQFWKQEGIIERGGVRTDEIEWTWEQWANTIKENFTHHFYVEEDCPDKFVNRRGIVKDSVGSTYGYTDFQLRPNFTIALSAGDDLIDAEKAWKALDMAKEHLLGPIGIKTLDPSDLCYNGFYNNDDDGTDKKTAKGWNYHQGPEWVWVAGFYLRARLIVGERLGGEYFSAAQQEVERRLGICQEHIQSSVWRSLPELTQENGEHCAGSCNAQAWSVSTILEASLLLSSYKHN